MKEEKAMAAPDKPSQFFFCPLFDYFVNKLDIVVRHFVVSGEKIFDRSVLALGPSDLSCGSDIYQFSFTCRLPS